MSKEALKIIKKQKIQKIFILLTQITIVITFLLLWELLSQKKIINPFIFSRPSLIIKTIFNLAKSGNLLTHILTTLNETIIAFIIGITLGFIIAIILYELPTLAKIIEPFLTMLNSLPKVALGPIIIIWTGANTKSIIVMALLINLIVSILNIYNGFLGTDENKRTIISSLKINISMTLIGVIMGEFLVSKKGIGYLIIYGTQVFNLNLVMAGIIILIILSFLIYECISLIEKKLSK